ncbi:MAG: thiol:disulfide interchange protein, partial [Pseudomonadales bacterium]|nr:thiol:disulfide interchange protein [Pseudomonadales bacterium]
MKRFFAVLALLLCIPAALAVENPAPRYVEGTHYVRLAQAMPTADPQKIEVVEVFWYGCIHCYHLEPLIETWRKTLGADVDF